MNSCIGPSPIYTSKGEDEQPLLPGGGGELEGGGLLSKIIFFAEIVLLKFFKNLLK